MMRVGFVVVILVLPLDLKKAFAFYFDPGGKGDPTGSIEKAVVVMAEKLEVVQQIFSEQSKSKKYILADQSYAYVAGSHMFDYRHFFLVDARQKLPIILQAEEHILGLPNGKQKSSWRIFFIYHPFISGQ